MEQTNDELPKAFTDALDDMVKRRMENTGETKEQASNHIADYLKKLIG